MTIHDPHIIGVIRRMKSERATEFEIAMAVGLPQKTVNWLCYKNKITKPEARRIPFSGALLKPFREEAALRGVPLDEFVRNILQTIATDNLFSAIIDDGK